MAQVKTGLEVIAGAGFAALQGQRIGLLVHPASVDRHLRPTVDLMTEAVTVNLTTLFGPQHGILGQTQDNMIECEGFRDRATGLPVHSLYGSHRKPTAEMLAVYIYNELKPTLPLLTDVSVCESPTAEAIYRP